MTFAEFLLTPEAGKSMPRSGKCQFKDTLDLAGSLNWLAMSTEDQERAKIMDEASNRLLELFEEVERLRAELRALEELNQ